MPQTNDKALARQYFIKLRRQSVLAGLGGLIWLGLGLTGVLPSLLTMSGLVSYLALGCGTLFLMVYAGAHFYVGAYRALRIHLATMDTLIAIGTGAAWVYSMLVIVFAHHMPLTARHVYFEAALIIIALVNLGALLELHARQHTSEAIERLIKLRPKTARVIRGNQELDLPLADLQVGDLIRVRPGEQIPVDGVMVEGESNIDESMLTGEPIPIHKKISDQVMSGTLNKTGSFIFKASQIGEETVLGKIIDLVKQAQHSKPALARLADKISAYFVPAVLLVAILTALIWFNVGVEPKMVYMMVTSMAVLVIACPCALGLAVPISVMVGIGKAAEYGVLIRHADALQQAGKLTIIVLDKTGTITMGKPMVTEILAVPSQDEKRVLQLAASLERGSEHPLAAAIVNAAHEADITLTTVTAFTAISGKGVCGVLDGHTVYLGNLALMEQQHIVVDEVQERVEQLQGQGQTVTYLAEDNQLLGLVAMADIIKPDSKQAILKLQQMGIKVLMITGDHQAQAQAIANQVGIKTVLAGVLPAEKSTKIKALQADGSIVGMAGDGINDAPALAQADVGFAIGAGTDVAIESAGITLMRSSLQGVVDAILISRKTTQNMYQNLLGAFIYNLLGIPIAAGILFPVTGILLNPMIAGAAMAFSSVTVVGNANRLRYFKIRDSAS